MTNIHIIAARPRPGVKRIPITDPAARLAEHIQRVLLDTSRNKDARIRNALTMCRQAQPKRIPSHEN
jgi:hypothetical protein